MRNVFKINKIIIYFLVGLFIILFHNYILNHNILYLVIGITTLVLAIEGLIVDIVLKRYKTDNNHIGSELFKIALSLVILIAFNKKSDFEMVCICWSIIVIIANTKTLNKAISNLFTKKKFMFSIIFSIMQLVLAIMLISNPEHHVKLHIIILGIEFIIESIRYTMNYIYALKNDNKEVIDSGTI